MPTVTCALQVFARRFKGTGATNAEIADRFDYLMAHGFLDFAHGADGELRVKLCERSEPPPSEFSNRGGQVVRFGFGAMSEIAPGASLVLPRPRFGTLAIRSRSQKIT